MSYPLQKRNDFNQAVLGMDRIYIISRLFYIFTGVIILILNCNPSYAEELDDELQQLLSRPIADFGNLKGISQTEMNKEEFSSSKTLTEAFTSPSSIYVITSEDIANSGAVTIPDVLRMVPGVQVYQAASGTYNVAMRGFNNTFSNKLLVLIDGRSIYDQMYSGVLWSNHNLIMEDISRIEVIRGPGGTVWGENAVNGVINIITKKAKSTQGEAASANLSTNGDNIYSARYGGKTKSDVYYTVHAKYTDMEDNIADKGNGADSTVLPGNSGGDSLINGNIGFKAEWKNSVGDDYSLSGYSFKGEQTTLTRLPIDITSFILPNVFISDSIDSISEISASGGNILGKWEREFSENSKISLQIFNDYLSRNAYLSNINENTLDIDLQYSFAIGKRNAINMGAGYRYIQDSINSVYIENMPLSSSLREDSKRSLYSAYLQDKISLYPDKLDITVGSKVSYNEFTYVSYQPSARIAWYPTKNQTVWTSVSRAVRVPDRITLESYTASYVRGAILQYIGPEKLESEKVTSYEAGYKVQETADLYFDISVFYNLYSNAIDLQIIPGTLSTIYTASSVLQMEEHGAEITAKWHATENTHYEAGYTITRISTDNIQPSLQNQAGNTPRQQFNLRAVFDLGNNVRWVNSLYYVGSLTPSPYMDITNTPAYTKFDIRFSWQPIEKLEVSFVGQNIFDSRHRETNPFLNELPILMGRTVFANIKLGF